MSESLMGQVIGYILKSIPAQAGAIIATVLAIVVVAAAVMQAAALWVSRRSALEADLDVASKLDRTNATKRERKAARALQRDVARRVRLSIKRRETTSRIAKSIGVLAERVVVDWSTMLVLLVASAVVVATHPYVPDTSNLSEIGIRSIALDAVVKNILAVVIPMTIGMCVDGYRYHRRHSHEEGSEDRASTLERLANSEAAWLVTNFRFALLFLFSSTLTTAFIIPFNSEESSFWFTPFGYMSIILIFTCIGIFIDLLSDCVRWMWRRIKKHDSSAQFFVEPDAK